MESAIRKELPKCPREKANFLSYLTFTWVMPIFFKGRTRTLGVEDLYQPLKQQESHVLGENWKMLGT